jgi:hypothetical protein
MIRKANYCRRQALICTSSHAARAPPPRLTYGGVTYLFSENYERDPTNRQTLWLPELGACENGKQAES